MYHKLRGKYQSNWCLTKTLFPRSNTYRIGNLYVNRQKHKQKNFVHEKKPKIAYEYQVVDKVLIINKINIKPCLKEHTRSPARISMEQ